MEQRAAFFREKIVVATNIDMSVAFSKVCLCESYQSFLVANVAAHLRFPSPNYFFADYMYPPANCKISNKYPHTT
jgi:hypothetical protein